MNSQSHETDRNSVPAHVAIIMDGNGRWAQARGLDRSEGHVEGVNTVRKITEEASELGIKYLTLYAFSTENWNRPQQEVDMLMHLIGIAIERETPDLIKNNVRLTMIGDVERMPAEALERLRGCISRTAHCTGLTLNLALSYSSRWEITDAVRHIAADVAAGRLKELDIDENIVSAYMATKDMPDPDLLIRTGGACEQLPAVADCLCRALFHTDTLAGFFKRGFPKRCCPVQGARAPFRPYRRADKGLTDT